MTTAFFDHAYTTARACLFMILLLLVISLPLCHVPVFGSVAETAPGPESLCKEWFDSEANVKPVILSATTQTIYVVTVNSETNGWIFRTDKMPPVCKGKQGEIILWVGLGTDSLIKGVQLIDHAEDKDHFSLLVVTRFFDQFFGRLAYDDVSVVDTVASATYSSRAIRSDVLLGARYLASQPEVAPKIEKPPQ